MSSGCSLVHAFVLKVCEHDVLTRSSATAEIARDAIKGHSRSCVVVPIDATYVTFYYFL